MMKLDPIHQKAWDEIQRLKQNPENRRLVDYLEHDLRGQIMRLADAREEGYKIGLEQWKRSVVIRMYKENYSIEDIAKSTKLPLPFVRETVESID